MRKKIKAVSLGNGPTVFSLVLIWDLGIFFDNFWLPFFYIKFI